MSIRKYVGMMAVLLGASAAVGHANAIKYKKTPDGSPV
jgi:hypothetical protein